MKRSTNKPDISQIEELLEAIQPQPSNDFYHRMQSSPWVRSKSVFSTLSSLKDSFLLPRFQFAALVAGFLFLLLLVFGFVNSPNFIAIAQQIAKYIMPAQSDQLSIPYMNTLTISPTTLDTHNNFPLNLEEAEDLTSHTLKLIPKSEYDLTFSGARYDPKLSALTLRYELGDALILFTQRPLGEIEEYTSVGASAPIVILTVWGVDGEYVEGGWRMYSENENLYPSTSPDDEINMGVLWDSNLPQRILRWKEDNFIFELLVTGNHELEQSDIVKIAESIQ